MSADDLLRLAPPSDVTSESKVLGALLFDSHGHMPTVPPSLVSESFYSGAHRHIFDAMMHVRSSGAEVTRTTVEAQLRKAGRIQSLEAGASYLERIEERAPVMVESEFVALCTLVVEYAARRDALASIRKHAIAIAHPTTGAASDALSGLEKDLAGISMRLHDQREMRPMREVMRSELLEWVEAQKRGTPNGISSGFQAYDQVTAGGMHRGDLVIVAARPGMGKTSFVMSCATQVAKRQAHVAIFSLEMPASQLAGRMLASETRLPLIQLKQGKIDPAQHTSLRVALSELAALDIYVDDCTRGRPTVKDIAAKARRLASEAARQKKRLGLVVVDYLQIVKLDAELQKQRHDLAVGEVSTELKSLAKELDTTIIGVAQLNRSVETRQDKRPMMSDLRDSGQLEQDADLILMLYRDRYYNPQKTGPDMVELLFQKNRHGPPARTFVEFHGRSTTFEDRSDLATEETE